MVEDVLPLSTPAKDSEDVWMVPKVAGRSCQWRIEAEGRGSAAGTPQAFVYFLFFWMVEDLLRCKRYCKKINCVF